METSDGARIGEDRPILCGEPLRLNRARGVPRDQSLKSLFLCGETRPQWRRVERFKRPVRFALLFGNGCG